MDSGNAIGPPYNGTEWHQPMYDRIVERAGYVHIRSYSQQMLTYVHQLHRVQQYLAMSPRTAIHNLVQRRIRGTRVVRNHRRVIHNPISPDQL